MKKYDLEKKELYESSQRQEVINALLRVSLEDSALVAQLEKSIDIILNIPFVRLEPKGCIFLKDDHSDELILIVERNLNNSLLKMCARVPFGHCLCGIAAQTMKINHSFDVTEDHVNKYDGMRPHGHYVIPILSLGKMLGILNLYIKAGHQYNKKETEFLKAAVNVLAGIIERKRAEERLQEKFHELERINIVLAQREKELESLDEMKTNFVSTISHELRTPLTAILGNTKLVLQKYESMPDKEKIQFLTVVTQQGDHLLNLINDILDVASAESGHLSLERTDIDIGATIDSSISFVDILAKEKGIRLNKNIVSQEKNVHADSLRIRQVFVNLLSNAIKFTPEGGEIIVKVEDYVHSKDVLLITVKDSGIGIPSDKLDTLFNRFIQVDNSPKRKAGGTGLGLAIIKELVHLHGGRIWVKSEEGKGSAFFFTILKSGKYKRVGEILVEEGKCTKEDINSVLLRQSEVGGDDHG